MYEHAKSLGITLITISLRQVSLPSPSRHQYSALTNFIRPSLTKFHTHLLTINGDVDGSWTLSQVGTAEERMELDREIVAIEQRLEEVEGWERRVKELTKALSVQEV